MSILNLKITGVSKRMQTKTEARKHQVILDEPPQQGGEDTGPTPLEIMLQGLAGCENIIANMVAKEMNFDLQGMEFTIEGRLDLRGLQGDPEVRPYFEKVTIHAQVRTNESNERVQELKEKTDVRCPLFTTLKAAGVEMETTWVKA